MTTSETTDAAPPGSALIEYRMPCPNCRGRGHAEHWLPEGWKEIRDRMVTAGRRRAASSAGSRGSIVQRQALEKAWADIRAAWADARELGITQDVCKEWADLGRAQFTNIVNGRVGGE